MVLKSLLIVVMLPLLAPGSVAAQQSPQELVELAEAEFAAGRVEESIAAFDRLAALVPSVAPTLWQRGIALYIAGRYAECAAQFRSFYAEDPGDLENADLAFSLRRASRVRRIVPALDCSRLDPTPRILRQQIYEMLGGQRTPEQLLELATKSVDLVQFYGYLYAGLYMDATGNRVAAAGLLMTAASERYDAYGGFMNVVAKVYVGRLRKMREQ